MPIEADYIIFNNAISVIRHKHFSDRSVIVDRKIINFYFKDVISSYHSLLDGDQIPLECLNNKITNPFHFKNMYFSDFTWKDIFRGLPLEMQNFFKNVHSSFIFEDCRFENFGLTNAKYLEKNHFKVAFLKSNFESFFISECNTANVSKIEFRDCVFTKFKFSPCFSPDNADPIFFKNCKIVDEFIADNRSFGIIEFYKTSFGTNKDSRRISFNNSQFSNSTEFQKCTFYSAPKFHNTKIHSDTSFFGARFLDISSNGAVDAYRVLKQKTHDIGDEHDSMMFHSLEMDARRKTKLPKWYAFWDREFVATLSSNFLKHFNNFGRNFWMPWMWIIGSLIIFSIIYWYFSGIGCNYYKLDESDIWLKKYCSFELMNSYQLNLLYSFNRLLGPLGLLFDSGLLSAKSFPIKLASTIQFISSSIFWYLIIIQIKRPFRL